MLQCFYNYFSFYAELFFTNKFSDVRNYFFYMVPNTYLDFFVVVVFEAFVFIFSRLCLGLLNKFSNVKSTTCTWFFVSISAYLGKSHFFIAIAILAVGDGEIPQQLSVIPSRFAITTPLMRTLNSSLKPAFSISTSLAKWKMAETSKYTTTMEIMLCVKIII